MARRKQSPLDSLAEAGSKLPWWAWVAFAIAAYLGLHGAASSEVTAGGQPGEFAGQGLLESLVSFGQYVLPLAFLLGAAISAYARYARRAGHEPATTTPDRRALNAMSWQQFEALVSEAFRCKGYKVTGKGGGGADGGIDLVLKKEGETFLVQCKQWRAVRVGVNIVRELYAVMAARGATGGFVVTSGVFTEEARAFAKGKHVELMDGKALHRLIRGVRVPGKLFRDPLSVMTTGAPFCPECQSRMVMRKAQHGANAGKPFWRCSQYPECKGTRKA